jgi:hypothetical protein
VGGDLAVAIDIEPYVDSPKLRWIETDIELIGAGLRAGAIATASPETGIEGDDAAADDAAFCPVAAVAATGVAKPKFGRPAVSIFPEAPAAAPAVPEAVPAAEVDVMSATWKLEPSALPAVVTSVGPGAAVALLVVCAC